MGADVIQWVRAVFRGRNGDQDELDDREGERRTNLYECIACERIYISGELESCPNCESVVERIPNERDLKIG